MCVCGCVFVSVWGVKYCMNMKIAPINRLYLKFCETLISTPRGIWISSPHLPPEDSLWRLLSVILSISVFLPLFLFSVNTSCLILNLSNLLSSKPCHLSHVSKLYRFLFATLNKLHKDQNTHTHTRCKDDAPAANTKGDTFTFCTSSSLGCVWETIGPSIWWRMIKSACFKWSQYRRVDGGGAMHEKKQQRVKTQRERKGAKAEKENETERWRRKIGSHSFR